MPPQTHYRRRIFQGREPRGVLSPPLVFEASVTLTRRESRGPTRRSDVLEDLGRETSRAVPPVKAVGVLEHGVKLRNRGRPLKRRRLAKKIRGNLDRRPALVDHTVRLDNHSKHRISLYFPRIWGLQGTLAETLGEVLIPRRLCVRSEH